MTTRLEEVQKDLRQLLPPDAILIGQSLNNDLRALQVRHRLQTAADYRLLTTDYSLYWPVATERRLSLSSDLRALRAMADYTDY